MNRPMLEIHEDKNIEKIDYPPQGIDEEWKKYNKRLDDLLDNVEIEAEMEAEKIIRSKNSKLAIISAIGIALLALIFIQVKQRSDPPPPKFDKKPMTEEAKFAPKKTSSVVPLTDQLVPANPPSTTNPSKVSTLPQVISSRVTRDVSLKKNKSGKTFQSTSNKTPTFVSDKRYFVQMGAFSIKKNATDLSKKIKSKGFKTEIYVRNTKASKYQVAIGSFNKKINSAPSFAKLKSVGFNPSIKKIGQAYILQLGLFKNDKDSASLAEKLQNGGFKPNTKMVLIEDKTYIVRVKGFTTESEARKSRQKLTSLGFENSFIQSL